VTSSTGQRGKYVARPDELTAGGDAGRSDLRPDEGRAEYLT
jgi:hypothetical protein